jgi:hypothetical protein
MHAFAKWAVVIASTTAIVAITTVVVLLFAGRNDSGWALATAWAVGAATLPMGVGTWWIGRSDLPKKDSSSAPNARSTTAEKVVQIAQDSVAFSANHSVSATNISGSPINIGTGEGKK